MGVRTGAFHIERPRKFKNFRHPIYRYWGHPVIFV